MTEAMARILGKTEDEIRKAVKARSEKRVYDSEEIPFVVDGISSDDPRFSDILMQYGTTYTYDNI